MATKTKQWSTGSGSATIQYGGQGDGQITITSDPNSVYEARSMQIVVETTDGSGIQRTVTINQAAKQRIDISAAVVTAATQTYDGGAKTPIPTVTLNGSTVPSSGYDVAYSNNTNAGTANITITGKGDYTGTATGTFTIAPATPSYTAPTAKTITYSGSSQALVNAGSSNHGTFTYKLSTASSYGSSIPTGTNAGSYIVNWKFVADANHGGGTFTGNISVDIAKANPVYVAPTANNRTYNTSSAALLVAGSNTTPGSFTYSSSQSGTYSSTIPSQTNAGTYTTWWKFTPTDTSNYNSVSATFISTTISPKTVSSPTITLSQSTYTYNGSAKTPTPTVKDGTVTISSSEYTVSYSNNTNAGTATCTITDKSGGNYIVSGSKTFTINKASRTLSFADTYMVLNTSSTGTKTATPSAGSGDGAITYSISSTTYATINSSSGKVTSKTSDGSATVTATIAEGTNYLSATATYTLYVFATTHNYDYNGSYRSVTLPPGTYQFQCWGAQGGSNAADPSLGITAQAGGKGGYSVGQLTISQATDVRVYVGGNGTTSRDGNVGAFNGGGAVNWGSSTKDEDGEYGKTRFGGGGGATDIRLSDGSLYSRMIVAGGGSGGAMCYSKKTTYQDVYTPLTTSVSQESIYNGQYVTRYTAGAHQEGDVLRVYVDNSSDVVRKIGFINSGGSFISTQILSNKTYKTVTCPANTARVVFEFIDSRDYSYNYGTVNADLVTQEEVVTETNVSQVGYPGGGANGGGYSSTYYGKQNGAGNYGSFGSGATQYAGSQRYVSGAGGGGWYGGGRGYSNTTTDGVKYSGGGSGWVNTSANASYRPSGYTGLQLDSGTTYAGNTSFPAPGGGNETGHSGYGYARITRLS